MRKLLSFFSCLTILGSGASSLVSCGTPNGNTVPFYIYNNDDQNIIHNPNAQGDKNNIFDASSNTDTYQFQAAMNASDYKNQISLSANLLMPLMAGINLSSDNTKNTDGVKWSQTQISESLFSQKSALESTSSVWKDFFNQYSSQEDTYFTQVAILDNAKDKTKIDKVPIITQVANVDKTTDKDLMNADDNQLNGSLYALSPVADALLTLNGPKLNLCKSDNNDFLIQNAAYALYSIGDVIFTFEFTGSNNNYWSFNVTLHNVAAKFQFLTFFNPSYSSSSKSGPTANKYIHQWFFTGYDFYNSSNFKFNDPNIALSSDNLAIGYANVGDGTANTNYSYSTAPKNVGTNGQFLPTKMENANQIPESTFLWLDWLIDGNSIKINDGSNIN